MSTDLSNNYEKDSDYDSMFGDDESSIDIDELSEVKKSDDEELSQDSKPAYNCNESEESHSSYYNYPHNDSSSNLNFPVEVDESLFASSSDEENTGSIGETFAPEPTSSPKLSNDKINSPITNNTDQKNRKLQSIPKKRKLSHYISDVEPDKSQASVKKNLNGISDDKSEKFKTHYSDSSTNISYNKNATLSSSLMHKQYPNFDVEHFWRTLRAWDMLQDLNEYFKPNPLKSDSNPGKVSNENHQSQILNTPIPNQFQCPDEYIASWAPLQLRETKSQILSDTSTIPIHKMITAVTVTFTTLSSEDTFGEILTVQIRCNQNDGRLGKEGNINNSTIRTSAGASRQEFIANDMILLCYDWTDVEKACHGKLFGTDYYTDPNNKDQKPMSLSSSLFASASPLISSRKSLLGIVTQRSKGLEHGITVQTSRRLWKKSFANKSSEMFLVRIGYNMTAFREFKALCRINEMPLTKYLLKVSPSLLQNTESDLLSDKGGPNALGIGFRIWVKSRFNDSQKNAINAAAREYGEGGFTLVKGPPGTGKTTTLVALLNALHLRQYQRYYSEIEKITLSLDSARSSTGTLAAISAAAKVKPRLLICAPSNAAVDNVILKIIEDRFIDGNGGKYCPGMVRVGVGQSVSVAKVSLKSKVDAIVSQGMNPEALEEVIVNSRTELKRLQHEIKNLQDRVRLIARATPYNLSRDWEIRIDEDNFKTTPRVIFVNHKLQSVQLTVPSHPSTGEECHPFNEMPHYQGCMNSLTKYVERHNDLYSKLEQLILVQNAASVINPATSSSYGRNSKSNQVLADLNTELEIHVLNSTHMVMTTLGSASTRSLEASSKFEVVVIDEAAQSSEPSTLPALHLGSSHAILVGDPQQLPATIFSLSGRVTKYDRSLFQRLEEAGHEVHMLNTQYRMHPMISNFPRRIFYDGSLLDGPNVRNPDYGGELSKLMQSKFIHFKPFTMFDLNSKEERGVGVEGNNASTSGTSLFNSTEAYFALYLHDMIRENIILQIKKPKGTGVATAENSTGSSQTVSVAIIAPYSQQVALLHRIFEQKYGPTYTRMVDISTVDAFQGREAHIVIFSCVRASASNNNQNNNNNNNNNTNNSHNNNNMDETGTNANYVNDHRMGIGFLSDVQRMNVALTRAKHYLFVIARCQTILVNPYWRGLISHASEMDSILKVDNYGMNNQYNIHKDNNNNNFGGSTNIHKDSNKNNNFGGGTNVHKNNNNNFRAGTNNNNNVVMKGKKSKANKRKKKPVNVNQKNKQFHNK